MHCACLRSHGEHRLVHHITFRNRGVSHGVPAAPARPRSLTRDLTPFSIAPRRRVDP